jgi:hypothetical protein
MEVEDVAVADKTAVRAGPGKASYRLVLQEG